MKKLILIFVVTLFIFSVCACAANEPATTTANTNEAVTTGNDPVQTSQSAVTTSAQPTVDLFPESGAYYTVKNERYFSLGATTYGTVKGENARYSSAVNDLDQIWRFDKLSDGSYNIINASAEFYLSVKENTDGTTSVVLDKRSNTLKQTGILEEAEDGIYIKSADKGLYIKNELAKKASDIILTDKKDGAPVWALSKIFDKGTALPKSLSLVGNINAPASCPEVYKHTDGYYYNINMTAGMKIKMSKDLITWMHAGDVFSKVPDWIYEELGEGVSIWAPGYYTVGDKLCIYYCASSSGSQNSLIGLVYADSPTGPFTDMGMVIRSHTGDPYNCIDPNIFVDDDGKHYLIFGSYWTGIYMRRINPETGFLDETDTTEWHLAEKSGGIEAPYIVKRDGYYYLFVAIDKLSGNNYHWAVGRSESLFGPYLDKNGKPMLEGGCTTLTEYKNGVQATAHAQPFLDSDGQWYMVSEMWPDRSVETPKIQLYICKMVWTEDGWPVTALSPNIVKDLRTKN